MNEDPPATSDQVIDGNYLNSIFVERSDALGSQFVPGGDLNGGDLNDSSGMMESSSVDDFNYPYYQEEVETVTKNKIDVFLVNLYKYFVRRGFKNIVVSQILSLFSVTFLVMFCIFLFSCVNLSTISNMRNPSISYNMTEAVDWSGMAHMHWYLVICLVLYVVFFVWRISRITYDIYKMKRVQTFYNRHLGISEFEIATIRWQKVLEKLNELQDSSHFYIGDDRFTAHNVANRICKKDNYLIAMFNKELFNFDIPVLDKWYQVPVFTKSMEWNIQNCVLNYVFDDKMKLKSEFLDADKRLKLSMDLKKRILIMGILNLVFMPFLFLFMMFWGLFQYGQDVYKDPSKISHREWTLIAEWRFKEFNELPHVFHERMKLSSKFADEYLEQFPTYWLSNSAKLVAFIMSTFLFVLLMLALSNDHILFNLEISPGKTVFWYMSVFSTILFVCRSLVRDNYIFYPDKKMDKISEYIHYIPSDWKDNASNADVKWAFMNLYQFRMVSMLMELFGLIINPILMLTTMRNSSLEIVDFIRNYTTVDQNLGCVCQFAVFEIDSNDAMMNSTRLGQLNVECKDDKLSKSVYHFRKTYDPSSFHMLNIRPDERSGQNSVLDSLMSNTMNINGLPITPTVRPFTGEQSTMIPSFKAPSNTTSTHNPTLRQQQLKQHDVVSNSMFTSQINKIPDVQRQQTFDSGMLIPEIDRQIQSDKDNAKNDNNVLNMLKQNRVTKDI